MNRLLSREAMKFMENPKSYSLKRILPGILLFLSLICLMWLLVSWGDRLDPAEEAAVRFVEAAYIHSDMEALRSLLKKPEDAEKYKIIGPVAEPGTIKVGSKPTGPKSKLVVIYLTKRTVLGESVHITMWDEGNDKWIVGDNRFRDEGVQSFEEFKTVREQKGVKIDKWKNHKLR